MTGKRTYKSELSYPPFGVLAELPNVRWKADKDGGQECYFAVDDTLKIWELVYLKRAGVRLLKQWGALEADRRGAVILAWVKAALTEKGIG